MERSHGLDIIRSIAILLVMVGHGVDIIYPFIGNFVGNIIHEQFGLWGVQLFFVLSGYLIGRILIIEYQKNEFGSKSIVHFWLRRWFRTVPNYFLFLIIYICIGLWNVSKEGHWNFSLAKSEPLYYYPFFLQNFLTPTHGFFSQSWSLTREEWFYISLPLLFFLSSRLMKKKVNPIFLIILFILLNWCVKATIHVFEPQVVGSSVIYSLDSIIYGVLMVSIQLQYPVAVERVKVKLFWFGLSIFLLAELFYLKSMLPLYPFFNTITAISLALFIPYSGAVIIRERFLVQMITTISKASYTIYLSNFLMVVYFTESFLVRLIPNDTATTAFIVLSIYIIVSILLAYIHYYVFEVPVMNLRDKGWIKDYFEKARTLSIENRKVDVSELVPEVVPSGENDLMKT